MFLKSIINCIADILASMCNKSFDSSIFPKAKKKNSEKVSKFSEKNGGNFRKVGKIKLRNFL
jgi:uncharacterized protein YozE (UPF0346 family)